MWPACKVLPTHPPINRTEPDTQSSARRSPQADALLDKLEQKSDPSSVQEPCHKQLDRPLKHVTCVNRLPDPEAAFHLGRNIMRCRHTKAG